MNKVKLLMSILILCFSTQVIADEYTVTIKGKQQRIALVSAKITPENGTLKMNEFNEHGLPDGWATYIEDVQAKDAEGKRLNVTPIENSQWRIEGYKGGLVDLIYVAKLEHDRVEPALNGGDNGAAYAVDDGVMWAGRAIFLVGKDSNNISIEFNLPENWKVTTQWMATENPRKFVVEKTDDLVNSAFFAGAHKHQEVNSGNVSMRVALAGEYSKNISADIVEKLGEYFDFYGKQYQSPLEANMILVVSDSHYDGGEVMGNAISISMGPRMRKNGFNKNTAHVIAHEALHAFFLNQVNIDDEKEDFTTYTWFNEGFAAEYGTHLAMLRTGTYSEAYFLESLVSRMDKYAAKLDGKMNLITAGLDKFKNYHVVYCGGLIAAMALDFHIRSETNGQKNLDELWQFLLKTFPRDGNVLTIPRLLESVEEVYGEKTGALISGFVNSPQAIDFYQYTELMGLTFDGKELTVAPNATEKQKKLWLEFVKG